MPVTFKRKDDLEKMLAEFAHFEQLDPISTNNEPKSTTTTEKETNA